MRNSFNYFLLKRDAPVFLKFTPSQWVSTETYVMSCWQDCVRIVRALKFAVFARKPVCLLLELDASWLPKRIFSKQSTKSSKPMPNLAQRQSIWPTINNGFFFFSFFPSQLLRFKEKSFYSFDLEEYMCFLNGLFSTSSTSFFIFI